jgi:hypothetical protein
MTKILRMDSMKKPVHFFIKTDENPNPKYELADVDKYGL